MRYAWEELPDEVRDVVGHQWAPVVKAEPATGGIMPGLACRLQLAGPPGDVFAKAVPVHHEVAGLHLREVAAHRMATQRNVPCPPLLWSGTVAGWHLLITGYINDQARHVDLSPSSPDLDAVLDTMELANRLLTPCPPAAVGIDTNLAPLAAKGRHLLAADPDAWEAGDIPADVYGPRSLYEVEFEEFDPDRYAGNTLLHYDLSSSNMLISNGRLWLLDWQFAVRGAAWVDAALLAPRLVEAGHSPVQADNMLASLPAWKDIDLDAVAGLAAAWTLFRLYKALHGPVEHRSARARAARAGAAWLAYLRH